MSDIHFNKTYSNIVVPLILLFPVTIVTIKGVGNLILLVLTFLGIYVLFKEKKSPFKIPELKLFSWLTFGYFLVMLLSVVQNEGFVDDLYHLWRKAHFAAAPLIGLALYRVNIPIERLLLSLKLGVVLSGCLILYQHYGSEARLSWIFNANIYGDIVLVMMFLSIANFVKEKPIDKFIGLLSVSLGIYVVVMSGNRGSFLLFIVLALVYVWLNYKSKAVVRVRYVAAIVVAVIVIILAISSIPRVQTGMDRAVNNFVQWKDHSIATSSTGARLEMWSGSIEAFNDAPWLLGYGYRKANEAVAPYTDPIIKERVATGWTHLHNEYITNLLSAGIAGLVSVLMLLFLPLKIYLKKRNNGYIYSFMGVMLCVSYAIIGLTHIALGEEHVNAMYIFILALTLPKVMQTTNESGHN